MSTPTIVFFASHFSGALPVHVKVYLRELTNYFSHTVLLCTTRVGNEDLDYLNQHAIQLSVEENEGFDFGLWYKAFKKFDVSRFGQVALVNDSCVLFKPLAAFMNWSERDHAEVQGMTMSEAVEPHVQSYFMLLKGKAVALAAAYFDQHGIIADYTEVIRKYEVGMSDHFFKKGLRLSAYIDNDGYRGEFSPYYHCIDYHLSKGMPLIKKRILFSDYRDPELFTLARMNFTIDPLYYVALIKKYNHRLLLDVEKLARDNRSNLSTGKWLRYHATRLLLNTGRPLYRLFKPGR